MKIAFPTLRVGLYPVRPGEKMDPETRRKLFRWGQSVGFDGVELEDETFGLTAMSSSELDELREELDKTGLAPCAVKNGGDLYSPECAEKNERDMLEAVRVAAHIGAPLTSVSLGTPVEKLGISNAERIGGTFRYAGSAWARDEDFETTAKALRRIAEHAGENGIRVSMEIRSTSIADNSTSAIRLYKMVDHPAFGLNPDVANGVWAYNTPDEDWRDCLEAMGPYTNYLHLKNLYAIRIPEFQRTVFKRGPLWDGIVDTRFLISHMLKLGYDGWCVIEGAGSGDLLQNFEQGLQYVRKILVEI